MHEEEIWDFYFSQKMLNHLKENAIHGKENYDSEGHSKISHILYELNVNIDGEQKQFTAKMRQGTPHTLLWDDVVFVGTTQNKNSSVTPHDYSKYDSYAEYKKLR